MPESGSDSKRRRRGGPLLAETELDAVALASFKIGALESLLSLIVRDCSFDVFMRELLLGAVQLVKSEAGSIFELDAENSALFARAVVGIARDKVKEVTIPFGQGIVGHVAESRQSVVANDVPNNTMHLRSVQNFVAYEVRNLIAHPIVIRGRVFGVLELLNRVGEDQFSPQDSEMVAYYCTMMAKVIEARLMLAWAIQSKTGSPRASEAA